MNALCSHGAIDGDAFWRPRREQDPHHPADVPSASGQGHEPAEDQRADADSHRAAQDGSGEGEGAQQAGVSG